MAATLLTSFRCDPLTVSRSRKNNEYRYLELRVANLWPASTFQTKQFYFQHWFWFFLFHLENPTPLRTLTTLFVPPFFLNKFLRYYMNINRPANVSDWQRYLNTYPAETRRTYATLLRGKQKKKSLRLKYRLVASVRDIKQIVPWILNRRRQR